MESGFLKTYSNRWLGRMIRKALINDFVAHVRVMPDDIPLSRIWRNERFRSNQSFHVSFAGVQIATIGGIDVSRYRRRATFSTLNVRPFAQGLDIELALLQGFAKAVRSGYGINAIILWQTGAVGTSHHEQLFPRLGAVRIGVSSKSGKWIWRTDLDPHRQTRLDFQRQNRGSFDEGTGVSIRTYRTEASPPAPPEYLFNVNRDGKRLYGMGFSGIYHYSGERDGHREWVYPLDATHPNVVRILLDFRESMPTMEDDFSFLRNLAMGFVLTNSGGVDSDSHSSSRYPLVTTAAALLEVGVPLPADVEVAEDGTVVLAEVEIPIVLEQ